MRRTILDPFLLRLEPYPREREPAQIAQKPHLSTAKQRTLLWARDFAETKKIDFVRKMGFRSRTNLCERIPTHSLYSFFRQIARAARNYFQNRNK